MKKEDIIFVVADVIIIFNTRGYCIKKLSRVTANNRIRFDILLLYKAVNVFEFKIGG